MNQNPENIKTIGSVGYCEIDEDSPTCEKEQGEKYCDFCDDLPINITVELWDAGLVKGKDLESIADKVYGNNPVIFVSADQNLLITKKDGTVLDSVRAFHGPNFSPYEAIFRGWKY